ncbi:HD domain-containing protein [Petrocella sp. FN5]|uniref:HD domain-containing protein n=1 Tax=Petrocella sp. FN5 TaxID=3032002 RepID=UPI0023DCAFDF|nr:HD domain-containing protein [Petrocella sp. FN5]MDF1615863.1 HD domain-containing protein [Petrocella sp. FN5]
MNLKRGILERIRYRVYEVLDQMGQQSYDYQHVRTVERLSLDMAKRRGLNTEVAQAIALLHDMGRITENAVGKEHATVGSKLTYRWLTDYDVDEVTKLTIVDAVAKHNRKKQIDGPYDELIKDCDALAHKLEIGEYLPKYEQLRCEQAYKLFFKMVMKDFDEMDRIFKEKYVHLWSLLKDVDEESIDGKWVHNIRTEIRTLRAMIWLLKGYQSKDIKRLDAFLKEIFIDLELSRKLTVFRKSLKKAEMSPKFVKEVSNLIQDENKKMIKKIKKKLLGQEKAIQKVSFGLKSMSHHEAIALKYKIQEDINRDYVFLLKTVSIKDLKSLHKLRIFGKKFLYLAESGLVSFIDEDDGELYSNIHKTVGGLNDIRENKRLLKTLMKKKSISLKKKEMDRLLIYYEQETSRLKQEMKWMLFKMKKRFL